MNIPIVVISHNNYKYVQNTLKQIKEINSDYYSNIIIMDNCSTELDTINYLQNIDVQVIFKKTNDYPQIDTNRNEDIYERLPNKFVVTDPDLQFNPKLPSNFIEVLSNLSDKYRCRKIGFALDISDPDKMFKSAYYRNKTIVDWESQFWVSKISDPEYELYKASIDTTFCLMNKNFMCREIRVAGNFLAKHIPWYIDNDIYNMYELYQSVYNTDTDISTTKNPFVTYLETNYVKIQKNNDTYLLMNRTDNLNFWKNIYSTWEQETFQIFDKYLRNDKTFIDIGSWIGTTSMYCSRRSKHIICVEADENSFAELQRNMKDNCDNNYTLINSYLKDTITIDSILKQNNVSPTDISLIKVDIEGGEENILYDIFNIHDKYNVPVYIRFYYSQWSDKNLDRFTFLTHEHKSSMMSDEFVTILFD